MDSASAPAKTARIPELDGVRGLALLGILVFHLSNQGSYSGSNRAIQGCLFLAGAGSHSVALFFMLSGYLISRIILTHRDSANFYQVFYFRRVCRIVPLYYCFLAFLFLVDALNDSLQLHLPGWLISFTYPRWAYCLFLQNIFIVQGLSQGPQITAPTWTLSVEEQFYLCLPILLKMTPTHRLSRLYLALLGGALLWRLGCAYWLPDPVNFWAGFFLSPGALDCFVVGGLVALPQTAPSVSSKSIWRLLQLLTASCILTLMLTPSSSLDLHEHLQSKPWLAICASVIPGYLGLFFWQTVYGHPQSKVRKLMRSRWLGILGRYSYCIYLVHMGCLALTHWFFGYQGKTPFGILYVKECTLALALTFGLARLSWDWIEKPCLQLGRRLDYIPPSSH